MFEFELGFDNIMLEDTKNMFIMEERNLLVRHVKQNVS